MSGQKPAPSGQQTTQTLTESRREAKAEAKEAPLRLKLEVWDVASWPGRLQVGYFLLLNWRCFHALLGIARLMLAWLWSQPKPHVRWAHDVVDNEHMNKKSSKRCCIFHKARQFGESDSDESDSDFEGDAPAPPKNRSYKKHETYHA
eukprot:scaffold98_cov244-Pinguiococcus_pyrenoidosus.AAC.9